MFGREISRKTNIKKAMALQLNDMVDTRQIVYEIFYILIV